MTVRLYTRPSLEVSLLVMYLCVCLSPDIQVKVVGILPQFEERSKMLKMVYALFERLSVYRYGRVELNLFISEKEYMVKEQEHYQYLNL